MGTCAVFDIKTLITVDFVSEMCISCVKIGGFHHCAVLTVKV